ncbi:MAG: hypothetical protein MZV64_63220 [Ignavibacteriales bacterium]|nr:hypothetical protein [Ignavibacteriales bacterium]
MTKAERFTLPRTGKIHVALTSGPGHLTSAAGLRWHGPSWRPGKNGHEAAPLFPRIHKFFDLFREDAANLRGGRPGPPGPRRPLRGRRDASTSGSRRSSTRATTSPTSSSPSSATPSSRRSSARTSTAWPAASTTSSTASRAWPAGCGPSSIARPTPEVEEARRHHRQGRRRRSSRPSTTSSRSAHVHAFCKQINILEYEADVVCREAIADLFASRRTAAEHQGPHQAQGDLRPGSRSPPTAARTWPTSSRASSSKSPEPHAATPDSASSSSSSCRRRWPSTSSTACTTRPTPSPPSSRPGS